MPKYVVAATTSSTRPTFSSIAEGALKLYEKDLRANLQDPLFGRIVSNTPLKPGVRKARITKRKVKPPYRKRQSFGRAMKQKAKSQAKAKAFQNATNT